MIQNIYLNHQFIQGKASLKQLIGELAGYIHMYELQFWSQPRGLPPVSFTSFPL